MVEVFCRKLQKTLPGFERPPYPGLVGQRIQQEISKEAWKQWLGQQTILINEHRLLVTEAKARAFLEQEMEQFLFG